MHSGKANGRLETVLIAGGAGFLGSHLCETMLDAGRRVLCVDSFLTGTPENVARFMRNPRFRLIEHDVCDPLDPAFISAAEEA